MKLTVAGAVKEIPDGTTVRQLIDLEKLETPDYVTVSINDSFIMGAEQAATVLQDGDVVEFLYFMGGGC